jgi:hypothetical protein
VAKKRKKVLEVIGWREWVALPQLGVKAIKAKVDSGARSSSLHVFDVQHFQRDGIDMVRFNMHPLQRSTRDTVSAEAPVLEHRSVRSSSGKAQLRPVIVTTLGLLDKVWKVEITLANRDDMGFRMLLGREAFRGRFLVDGGNSYYGGKPARPKKQKKKNGSTDETDETSDPKL